jgi:hypothetical protein
MISTPASEQRPWHGRRLVALTALFAFGCTVVRAPAAGMSEVIPVRDGRAEPQLALWVEGGTKVAPDESEAAAARARAALSEAAQGLAAPEDGVLVVRAQGLTRTRDRRADQTRATVAMVVGAVVVVAVVVVALVATKGGGSGADKAAKSVKAAPSPHRGGGARGSTAGNVRVAPAPGRAGGARPAPMPHAGPVRPAPLPGKPVPHGGVAVYGGVQVNLWNPWYPYDATWDYVPAPATGETTAVTVWTAPPAAADGAPFEDEGEGEPPRPAEQLRLWPAQPLAVEERGFWARDELMVELVVVDRFTGEPRLRKIARRAIDPCDAKAVRRLLEETLRQGPWERLSTPSAPSYAARSGR